MQKIFYVTFSSIPSELPSSLQIIKTCESFVKNNYDVTLIKPATGLKNITIKKFYDLKYHVNINEFKLVKKFPRGLDFYFFSIYCLFTILKNKKSITITRNYFTCFLLTLFKKKVVLEIHHDTNIEGRITKFILRYFNFLNNEHLINIVAITKSVKKLFISKYKVYKKKITVLPSGSSIVIKKKTKLFNSKIKVGYFGSLSTSKGINTLIKLSKIDKENDYYIFGGSKNQIYQLRKKFTNKNLYLKESIPYYQVPQKMMSMDVLAIPYSKEVKSSGEVDNIAKYTSPLKLFDYLAVGKAIISTELKVLREVIDHKNAYFIKNGKNVYEWKMNINKIKNNKKKFIIMCKNNLNLSKKYNHNDRVKKYIKNHEI